MQMCLKNFNIGQNIIDSISHEVSLKTQNEANFNNIFRIVLLLLLLLLLMYIPSIQKRMYLTSRLPISSNLDHLF